LRVSGTNATVKSPSRTTKVTLKNACTSNGLVRWTGQLKISPKSLHNSDAGAWTITYTATGDHPQSVTVDGDVRRASRATFNAGPQPVRNNTITFSGKLERANWNTRHYAGYSRKVTLYRNFVLEDDDASVDVVAEPTITKTGTQFGYVKKDSFSI
jgi:hypothetical protein